MQKQWFSYGFSMFFITLQKCIRRRFATDLGGPKLSFGASFGCPKPPMGGNLEAQSLPRTPTWTPKALPDLQVGVQRPSRTPTWKPKALQDINLEGQDPILEAQSAPTPQLGGPRRFKEVHLAAKISPPRSNTSKNLTSDD